jgi:very-short-patch-repair endonuclease
MKIKNLDGTQGGNWPQSGNFPTNDELRIRSNLHIITRKALRERYPTQRILEEVTIPGLNLYLDFYLPLEKLAVECQGKQHTEYVPHFHKDKAGFTKSQKRDSLKRQWCTLNNIRLEEIDYSEDEEKIKKRISEF